MSEGNFDLCFVSVLLNKQIITLSEFSNYSIVNALVLLQIDIYMYGFLYTGIFKWDFAIITFKFIIVILHWLLLLNCCHRWPFGELSTLFANISFARMLNIRAVVNAMMCTSCLKVYNSNVSRRLRMLEILPDSRISIGRSFQHPTFSDSNEYMPYRPIYSVLDRRIVKSGWCVDWTDVDGDQTDSILFSALTSFSLSTG